MADKTRKLFLDILKYTFTLGIAAVLLWYVYRDFSFQNIKEQFANINYYWISLSVVLAMISHYFRALRWNILLEPLGFKPKPSRTFIAVMVGYFANNLVPRLGEVTRCGILKKTDNVAMTSAFGSVVAERALDLLTLIVLAAFTFFIEFDKLNEFVMENFADKLPNTNSILGLILGAGLFFIVIAGVGYVLARKYREILHRNPVYLKIRKIVKELLDGFLSIRKIEKQGLFWFLTIAIWGLYYGMLIPVFFAYEPTANLNLLAGLTILIMSGLGMSAPVQGGIGVFHILVSSVLVLYGVSAEEGKVFALVAHTSQFLTLMFFGGISFIISVFLKPQNSHVDGQ